MMRLVFAPLILLVIAVGSLDDGTEQDPELLDPVDDVQYSRLHQGQQQSPFLDVVSGWFSYENASDEVEFTWSVKSAEFLANPSAEFQIGCNTTVEVLRGSTVEGSFSIFWWKSQGQTQIRSHMEWNPSGQAGGGPAAPRASFRHRFFVSPTEPGYYTWSIDRNILLGYGEEVANWGGSCFQTQVLGGVHAAYSNFDTASSKGAYSIVDLRRTRGAAGDPEPWETAASSDPTASAFTSGEASGFGLAAAVLGALVCVLISLRR